MACSPFFSVYQNCHVSTGRRVATINMKTEHQFLKKTKSKYEFMVALPHFIP